MDDALRWPRRAGAEAQQPASARGTTSERTGGDGDDTPIRIAVVGAPVESEMAREALAESGIPTYIKGNSLGPIYGLSVGSFGSAEVWVPAPLAGPAREVLIGIGLLDPQPE